MHRGDRRGDDEGNLRHASRDGEGRRSAGQLDLHDGAFRRARLAGADAPARRHARPDGQAVRRDHREPDHLQLQGRALGARVLQLDARRPQGPRRHRAEDGQLRLSDAPPRRRGAGLHHHRCGLRHDARHQGARHHRCRHRCCVAGKPHPRPHYGRGRARSVEQRSAGAECDAARRAARREARQCRRAGDQDPFGAHLRDHERLLRHVLWARSCPRHSGQYGRGGGRHRRAVDRRAGHAAHHAHVPHRRRGANFRAVVRRVELRGHDQDQEPQRRPQLGRRVDRDEPQSHRRRARSGRHRTRRAPHSLRRTAQGR